MHAMDAAFQILALIVGMAAFAVAIVSFIEAARFWKNKERRALELLSMREAGLKKTVRKILLEPVEPMRHEITESRAPRVGDESIAHHAS